MKKHDLPEILSVLRNTMDKTIPQIIRSGSVDALGVVNPLLGVAAGMANNFHEKINEIKLALLLKGLSRGLDMEKGLNQLYNYVTSSPDRAFTVANLFRHTINADCPKVCIIYGLILSNHQGNNTDFTNDELIVCKAIENATDCDLNNFKEIMGKYIEQGSSESIVSFPHDLKQSAEYMVTCNWATYNRLFISQTGRVENGTLILKPYFVVDKPAKVLLNYIEESHRIWDYKYKKEDNQMDSTQNS